MATRKWLAGTLAGALVLGVGGVAAAPKATRKPNVVEPRAHAASVSALKGTDVEAAAKAAEQLGKAADPAAHDALLAALAFGLPSPVAVAAINGLVQHPAPRDVAELKRYARHRKPAVRSAAVGALAMYPDPTARKAIVAALGDLTGSVRASAAAAAAKGRVRDAIEPLFELLARGEDSAGQALAAMADIDLARKLGEHLGKVPDGVLAQTLGLVLVRADFGPDAARVDLVRAIGKIQGPQAVAALTTYVERGPKSESRAEAEKMIQARAGGAK